MSASFRFDAIGTSWQIDLPDPLLPGEQERILRLIEARIAAFDLLYSRFREDSWVSRLAREGGESVLPEDAKPLFDLYQTLERLTNGAFTPLIGATLEDAGYNATYSLTAKPVLHTPKRWDEVIEYAPPHLLLKEPALLDFGAGGKGYLVELVGELLHKEGIHAFTIDAGGDILHEGGTEALRIGLEDPEDLGKVIGAVTLERGSICGSAGSRRVWGEYHHIINAHTLSSPRDVLATWVMARSALLADAIATALFFVPPEALQGVGIFDYVIMHEKRQVNYSPGLMVEFF